MATACSISVLGFSECGIWHEEATRLDSVRLAKKAWRGDTAIDSNKGGPGERHSFIVQ